MTDVLRAVVLGIIEGLTEFLPVSSTGHLVIAMPLMDISASQPPWSTLLWVSQFGAILAVVVYFWRDLWKRCTAPLTDWRSHLLVKLAAAMIPTVVIALLLKRVLTPLEESPTAVAAALIVGAFVILFIDRRYRRQGPMQLDQVTLAQAFWIGVIQCISMWPGVSRSGASIMGGMVLGLTPRVAAQFSFYLAIPTMLAAGVKTLWDERHTLSSDGAAVVLVGTATSFVVALIVVATFMEYVKRRRFTPFVIYRIALGLAVLAFYWRA